MTTLLSTNIHLYGILFTFLGIIWLGICLSIVNAPTERSYLNIQLLEPEEEIELSNIYIGGNVDEVYTDSITGEIIAISYIKDMFNN